MQWVRYPQFYKEQQYEAVDPFKASITYSFTNLFGTVGTEQHGAEGDGGSDNHDYDSDSDMNSLPIKWHNLNDSRVQMAPGRQHLPPYRSGAFTPTPPHPGSDAVMSMYGTSTAVPADHASMHHRPTYRPAPNTPSLVSIPDNNTDRDYKLQDSNRYLGGTFNTPSVPPHSRSNHRFEDTSNTPDPIPCAESPWSRVSRHRYSRSKSRSTMRPRSRPSRSRTRHSRFRGRRPVPNDNTAADSSRDSQQHYKGRSRRRSRSRRRRVSRGTGPHPHSPRSRLEQIELNELQQHSNKPTASDNRGHQSVYSVSPRTMPPFSTTPVQMPEPAILNDLSLEPLTKEESERPPPSNSLRDCSCSKAPAANTRHGPININSQQQRSPPQTPFDSGYSASVSMPEPRIPNIIPDPMLFTHRIPSPAYPDPYIASPNAVLDPRRRALHHPGSAYPEPHSPNIIPSRRYTQGCPDPTFPKSDVPNASTHSSPRTGYSMRSASWGSLKTKPKQLERDTVNKPNGVSASPSISQKTLQRQVSAGSLNSQFSGLRSQVQPPTIINHPWSYVLAIIVDTLPRQIYLHLLLRLPSLYFTRVSRIFEEAEMSICDIKQGILETAQKQKDALPLLATDWASFDLPVSEPYQNLNRSWTSFIDSLLEEWKTLNFISVLLLMAILTILQIEGSATDPLTRFTALISMVCALMSLLFGCMYIIRFGTMRKAYKAAEWASEAKRTRTGIFWNVWVMLAMPAAWLAWSMISYLVCVMSFVWNTGTLANSNRQPFSDEVALVPRLVVTVILALGLVYFCMIAITLRRYGTLMDRAWQRRVQDWIFELDTHYYQTPTVSSSSQMSIKYTVDKRPASYLDEKLATFKSKESAYTALRSPPGNSPRAPAFSFQPSEKALEVHAYKDLKLRESNGAQHFPPPGIGDGAMMHPSATPDPNIGYKSSTISPPQSARTLIGGNDGPLGVLENVVVSGYADNSSTSSSSINSKNTSKSSQSPKRGRRLSRLSQTVCPSPVGLIHESQTRIHVSKRVGLSTGNRAVALNPPRENDLAKVELDVVGRRSKAGNR